MESRKKLRTNFNLFIFIIMIGFIASILAARYITYRPYELDKEVSVAVGTTVAWLYILMLREVPYFSSSYRRTGILYAFFVLSMMALAGIMEDKTFGIDLLALLIVSATCAHPRYGVAAMLTFVLLGLWLTNILLQEFLVVLAASSMLIAIVGILRQVVVFVMRRKTKNQTVQS